MGVDPATVVLHYVYTKHPGGVGPTSFDCPRDHEFSVPDGPHRAGRTRSEAWMGVVGEGTVQGWGVALFAIWGCDRGDGRAGGLCRLFLRCGADHVGVFVGIVRNSGTIGYEFGNRCRGCFSGFGACRVRVEANIWHA